MKKLQITLGSQYVANVGGTQTCVTVDKIREVYPTTGKRTHATVYDVTEAVTGHKYTFRSARKFVCLNSTDAVANDGTPDLGTPDHALPGGGLDTAALREVERAYPQGVQKVIANALRLAKAARAEQPRMVVVEQEREFDGESGLNAIIEAITEAGIAPAQEATSTNRQRRKKGPKVDHRMYDMLKADPTSVDWTAQQWADKFGCSATAVKLSPTWTTIMKARAMYKDERAERDARPDRDLSGR